MDDPRAYTVAIAGAGSDDAARGGWATVVLAPNGIEVCRRAGRVAQATPQMLALTALVHGLVYVPRGATATIVTEHPTLADWSADASVPSDPVADLLMARVRALLAARTVRVSAATSASAAFSDARALAQAEVPASTGTAAGAPEATPAGTDRSGAAARVALTVARDDAYALLGLLAAHHDSPAAARIRAALTVALAPDADRTTR